MTDPAIKTNIGFTSLIIPATGRYVKLEKSIVASASSFTMEESGVDYIVPAGKKLWILQTIITTSDGADRVVNLYKHTVVDTAGGTLIQTDVTTGNTGNSYDDFISIEAAKYINIANGAAITDRVKVYGVELDA